MEDIIYITSGLFLLFLGGEALLRGCVSLAHSLQISKIFIAAVIIGFGTSMPELTVSVGAALKNSPDIALGNVIGSNIANILLILAIAALIFPIKISKKLIHRDVLAMLFSSALLMLLMWFDMLNFISGLLCLLLLVGYIMWSFIDNNCEQGKSYEHMGRESTIQKPYKLTIAISLSIFGLITLIIGAALLVDGAISLATHLGVSETVIGLTVVAVGTALPELAIAVLASIRQQGELMLGNILGSNIFNSLIIVGMTSIIRPISVSPHLIQLDIWVLLASSLFLSILLYRQITIGRCIGLGMILSYVIYIVCLYN